MAQELWEIGWILIDLYIKFSVQTIQPLIVTYWKGNFCVPSFRVYISLSAIVLSLKVPAREFLRFQGKTFL